MALGLPLLIAGAIAAGALASAKRGPAPSSSGSEPSPPSGGTVTPPSGGGTAPTPPAGGSPPPASPLTVKPGSGALSGRLPRLVTGQTAGSGDGYYTDTEAALLKSLPPPVGLPGPPPPLPAQAALGIGAPVIVGTYAYGFPTFPPISGPGAFRIRLDVVEEAARRAPKNDDLGKTGKGGKVAFFLDSIPIGNVTTPVLIQKGAETPKSQIQAAKKSADGTIEMEGYDLHWRRFWDAVGVRPTFRGRPLPDPVLAWAHVMSMAPTRMTYDLVWPQMEIYAARLRPMAARYRTVTSVDVFLAGALVPALRLHVAIAAAPLTPLWDIGARLLAELRDTPRPVGPEDPNAGPWLWQRIVQATTAQMDPTKLAADYQHFLAIQQANGGQRCSSATSVDPQTGLPCIAAMAWEVVIPALGAAAMGHVGGSSK